MLAMGAPLEAIDQAVAAEEARDPPFEVHDDNERIVELFLALGTQWRVVAVPMGGIVRQGIEYSAVEPALRMLGTKRNEWPEIFAGLRIMEDAALAVLNAKADG